jgi:hypothetical protein
MTTIDGMAWSKASAGMARSGTRVASRLAREPIHGERLCVSEHVITRDFADRNKIAR